ncbi:MAG: ion transporter, partial [Promethearchaeia archaeon]
GQQGAKFKMLRLLRLGRAVRLFSALKDLNRLIMAVSSALYPVCNAFLILFITSCVYGVLGTNFFREMEPEYFENFLTSLFTMFQVLTGDSWASAVSRTLFINHNGGKTNYAIAFFFISYILICSVMLLNVVIAVLLDEFISSVTREREEEQRLAEIEINKRKVVGPLDPLTKDLITFEDEGDLSKKVAYLYHKLDEDASGGLNFDEFQHGLKLLKANIHLTREDFDIVTGLVNLF